MYVTGFKTLIQKEWLSFGHPFQWRSGYVSDVGKDDQIAPIFIQFLDCVWQLLRLFPRHFEFNSRYLLVLSDHVYSCRFGTFIFNCEYEKVYVFYIILLSIIIILYLLLFLFVLSE